MTLDIKGPIGIIFDINIIPSINFLIFLYIQTQISPTSLNKDRIKQLLRQNDAEVSEEIQKAFSDCDPKSPVQAAFISKMISIPRTELPQNRRGPITMEEIRARRAKAENAALMVSKMAAMNLEKPEESGDYVELEPNKLIINGIELTETKDQERNGIFIIVLHFKVCSERKGEGTRDFRRENLLSPFSNPANNTERVSFPSY
jgi:ribosome assembly protein 1